MHSVQVGEGVMLILCSLVLVIHVFLRIRYWRSFASVSFEVFVSLIICEAS